MRLIDADAVISKGTKVTDDVIAVHNALAKAPTIDAVEVVRCKDCKYCGHGKTRLFCKQVKGLVILDDDTFCSYGEREADNG